MEAFRRQIAAHRGPAESGHAATEGQRLYLRGERMRQDGNLAEARKLWTNLAAAFNNVPSEKEWVEKAQQGVADIEQTANNDRRLAPVRAALSHAAALRDQGKMEEAEAIWRSLEELYQNDPGGAEVLKEIKAGRKK